MKILKKIKDNFSNEKIGTVEDTTVPVESKQEKKAEPKPEKKKTKLFAKNEQKADKKSSISAGTYQEEEDIYTLPKSENLSFNADAVLKSLRIKETIDISELVTEDFVRDIVFDVVYPKGIDPSQMNKFCNLMEKDIQTYRELIKQRDEDIKKLAEENSRIQTRMQEERQRTELANFVSEQRSQEEQLRDVVVELRMENEELKREIKKLKNARPVQQEDKSKGLPSLGRNKGGLPTL